MAGQPLVASSPLTTVDLAVFGCHPLGGADVSGQKRTQTNVYGRPHTVLKTADQASADVCGHPRKMSNGHSESTDVRQ
jgi:hypothetical protein